MPSIKLIKHGRGAIGLRWLGLGPGLKPIRGLKKLKILFDDHAFWAENRDLISIKRLLAGSQVVISVWEKNRIVGFGRATSDSVYRAVLWDVIVPQDLQGKGLGKKIVDALLRSDSLKNVERIYLMTSNCSEFYNQFGFEKVNQQSLLLKKRAKQRTL